MTEFEPQKFSVPELLRCFAAVLEELKARGVVRTRNNPVADYAELLVSQRLELRLMNNSAPGYDAVGMDGQRYQVKSRRIVPSSNPNPRVLSVIRNLGSNEFDFLIGILFDQDFTVKEAYKIPHEVITKFAHYRDHVKGHVLHLRGDILKEPSVENITSVLRQDATDG